MLLRVIRISRILSLLGYLLWALIAGPAEAQQPAAHPINSIAFTDATRTPDTTVGDALRHLAFNAGVAFAGSVQSIELPDADHPSSVIVTFQVIQPMLGDLGPVYTLREWAGLWTMGRQRYTVGQRALFFLHPVNAAGLSSPVDGMEGILPLIPTSADASPLLDVRRLATRILRHTGDQLPNDAITLAEATAVLTQGNSAAEPTLRALPAVASTHTHIAAAAAGVCR
jgi:hypothetical protein